MADRGRLAVLHDSLVAIVGRNDCLSLSEIGIISTICSYQFESIASFDDDSLSCRGNVLFADEVFLLYLCLSECTVPYLLA